METIPKLNRTSTLHLIIETINALIDSKGERDDILSTLVSSSIGVKEVYTATDNVYVSGEVYHVTSSGLYQISIQGTGTTHILIEYAATNEITEHKEIKDNWQSPEMLLSEGDKVIFWASSDPGEKLDITLSMVGNFFSLVQQLTQDYQDFNVRIDKLLSEYEGLNKSCQELIGKANLILDNHTNQVAQFQRDLEAISKRIEVLP